MVLLWFGLVLVIYISSGHEVIGYTNQEGLPTFDCLLLTEITSKNLVINIKQGSSYDF